MSGAEAEITPPGTDALSLSRPRSAKPFVVLTAILASSLAFIDNTVVIVALPQMRESLGASLAQAQWITNAYALTLSAFLLLGGGAGDTFGLRRVFMIGTALFAAASMLCGVSSSADMLIAARALQGIGGALMVPGSLALISANFPPGERGKAIGTWAAASGIAAALGPMLGGWLVDHGPWATIFWINVPIAALALWLCWRRVPETAVGTGPVAMDWIGGVLAILGLGALSYGLTIVGDAVTRGLALGSICCGAAILVAFLWHEARAPAPMMPLGLFRIRAFAGINAVTLLLYFGLSGAMFFLPTTLIEAHGYSAARAGSVFLPFTLVMAVLSRMGGVLADRWGAGRLLTVGPLLTGVSFALLVPAVANGGFWAAVVPVMLLMGLGMGITVAPLSTVVLNAVAVERAGVASGINNAISRIAGLVAVSALGAVATFGFQRVGTAAEPGLAQVFADATFGASLPINGSSETSAALIALYRQATIAGFAWAASISSAAALLSAWFGYKLEPPGSTMDRRQR